MYKYTYIIPNSDTFDFTSLLLSERDGRIEMITTT